MTYFRLAQAQTFYRYIGMSFIVDSHVTESRFHVLTMLTYKLRDIEPVILSWEEGVSYWGV